MKTLAQVLNDYSHSGVALPAFNIDCFEIYQAVELAVQETHKPCIVQLSSGEDKFVQAERLLALVHTARANGLPIYTNMDHGKDTDRLHHLVRLGFDMIHFDGSELPYEENILKTKEFVLKAHTDNPQVLIETEFNRIGKAENGPAEIVITDPQQATEFINYTKADILAVSIGNVHGISTDMPEKLNLEVLSDIKSKLGATHLTLHGGSGIPRDQIFEAVKRGIVKININTELRRQFRSVLTDTLQINQSEKVYDYLNPVITELKESIKQKLHDFSSIHV